MPVGTTTASPSGNLDIDALLTGVRWDSASLTYGFPAALSNWTGYAQGSEPFTSFKALTAGQQAAVAAALETWTRVATVTLTPVTEPQQAADIRYAGTGRTNTSHTYYPNPSPAGGDVWLGARVTNAAQWRPGNYEFHTLVHETGHALGLKHPHDTAFGTPAADAERDSVAVSVMSYRSYPGVALNGTYTLVRGSYPAAPMMNDIAAIQHLYGANYATNADDTVYAFDPGSGVLFQTIWDGGGTDTYDLSAYGSGVILDLRPGAWSTVSSEQLASLDVMDPSRRAPGNIANALLHDGDPRSLIENAIGGPGSDVLIGNAANNRIAGGGGDDTIDGGSGGDWVELGNGGGACFIADAETLVGGSGGDWVNLSDRGNTLVLAALETLIGGSGSDAIRLGDRGNTLVLTAIETLTGGSGQDFVRLGDRGSTLIVAGVETLVGGDRRDDVSCLTDAVRFDGQDGADRLILQAGANADQIIYAVPEAGGGAGQSEGYDQIFHFQSGTDTVGITGALRALVDDDADGVLGAAELRTLDAPLVSLNDDGFASLRAALGSLTAGEDALVLATDGRHSGLFVVQDDGDGSLSAGAVRMLARFDGALLGSSDLRMY